MKTRMRRATPEELKSFEAGSLIIPPVSGGCGPSGPKTEAAPGAETKDYSAGMSLPEIRIEGYDWLSDEAIRSLTVEKLINYAIQQREVIALLVNDRQELVGTIMNFAERNNLLLRDVFGQKTDRLQTIIGTRPPKNSSSEESPSASVGEDKEEPVQKDDSDSRNGAGTGEPGDRGTPGQPEKEKRKPRRADGCMDKQCEGLPVVEKHVEYTDEELDAFFGRGNWHRQESNDRVVIEYVCLPRQIYVRKTVLHCYAADDPTAETVKKEMVTAPNPVQRVRTYSRLTEELLGYLFYQRYGMRLPWERIIADLRMDGLQLNPQQLEENTRYYYSILMSLLQRMWCILFSSGYIQIDETPVLIYDQKERIVRRCWFWVFTVSELYRTDKRVVLFVFAHGRGTDVLRKYLAEDHEYHGYATTDGHSPYHLIEKETGGAVRDTGCLNHLRTRLIRVIEVIPGLKKMSQEELDAIPAFRALDKLRIVFQKERLAKDMTAEERAAYRQDEVIPELENAFSELKQFQAEDYPQGSGMYEALTYLKNQEEHLMRFTEDGNIPLTNSNSERCNAFFGVLRSSSRLYGSDTMAETGAGWESLIQTARLATDHVDIYFQYLFACAVPFIREADLKKGIRHTAKTGLKELNECARNAFGDTSLDQFLPWSEEYKKYEARILKERMAVRQQVANAVPLVV